MQVEVLGSGVVVNGDVIDGAGAEEHLVGFAGFYAVVDGSDVVVALFCIGDNGGSVAQAFADFLPVTIQVVCDAGVLSLGYGLFVIGQDSLDSPVVV